MKIIYISNATLPSTQANSVHVMKMCSAFAADRHDVTLVAPNKAIAPSLQHQDIFAYYGVPHSFKIKKLPWVGFPGRGYFYAFCAAIYAIIQRPDFVYGRHLQACWLAAECGLPVGFEVHDSLQHKNRVEPLIFKRLSQLRNFRGLCAITRALQSHYMEQFDVPEARIMVAPDGADPMPDSDSPMLLQSLSSRLNIGYIGSLYKGRGIDLIIQLAAALPQMQFHIVGGNTEEVLYWKGEAAGMNNMTFYGHVSHGQTHHFIPHFDILLAPYQKKITPAGNAQHGIEQWLSPLKIFEYMSSGKPFICSDMPVFREVLEDRVNCLLCPGDDVNAWVDAIQLLAQDDKLSQSIADHAQQDFLRKYTWFTRAQNITQFMTSRISA